jgi:2-polyprenyl-3-methyl-5-hydroxy-6-metoxy-1,4-benzoquinol methylase
MADQTEMNFEAKLALALSLTDDISRPNVNRLQEVVRHIPSICLNLKFFGYELARQLAAALPTREGLAPRNVGLQSKASTQSDMEADWVAYWCQELKIPVIFHRKIWELSYVMQAMFETGKMRPGMSAVGFGCGVEALPSYFASKGVQVVITDLPPDDSRALGWADTNQHTATLNSARHENLVEREEFDRLVSLRYVDMNDIPADLEGHDFCWSVCALEHLGSIEKGLNFIENSLNVLKPGGVAVHTTEYNFMHDEVTIDNWGTVLFLRKHFQEIHDRLTRNGHKVRALDFSIGDKPMDRFVDLPPFPHNSSEFMKGQWPFESAHLKVSVDGFPCTCFGLVIEKAI